MNTDTLQKYDRVGNLVWVKDRREYITKTGYNGPTRVTDAKQQTIETFYDEVGNISRAT